MGFTVERFDHVVLNCRDVAATAAWYERVLGMTWETFGPSNRTALCFGNQKINLRPVGAQADDPDWFTGSVEAAGSEDLCFVTRCTPAEVRAHLAECGVEITAGPVTKIGALGPMTSHYRRDIDGNLIEIAVYLKVGRADAKAAARGWGYLALAGGVPRTRPQSGYSAGRSTTIASWVLRAITTSAGLSGSGFSSRCGKYGGTKM